MSFSPLWPTSQPGSAAAENTSAAPSADARQWQTFLNRGLSENAQAAIPERGGRAPSQPAIAPAAPTAASGAPLPTLGNSAPPGALTASPADSPAPRPAPAAAAPSPALWPREFLPRPTEALSTAAGTGRFVNSQVVERQDTAFLVRQDGMPRALPPNTMIADLSPARFSSVQTRSSASRRIDPDASRDGQSEAHPAPLENKGTELRPMRWFLPWLWQMSQSPVEEGEPIDWEVDLPEGDRLRLHGVRHYGEWILDFAGSSDRLQRWLSQHAEDLAGRLQRIIGKPVRLFLDPKKPLSSNS